jgi:7,8-dihydropterin-6-yl-methyl-4-(beta-D-ribofuranosyl)aminobenzene 5'-phosphate synthase
MVIKALVENTSLSEKYKCEHGLSLFIETVGHKVLFDMGSSDLFYENARNMGVDIKDADIAVLSHGHFDHGGGLRTFLTLNQKAQVHIRLGAFDEHIAVKPDGETQNIGLDEGLKDSDRISFTRGYLQIDDGIELFSDVRRTKFLSLANKVLKTKVGEQFIEDDFVHEQNLILSENGKSVLFAGCAHSGIVNILERYGEIKGRMPDVVIGGFHLFNPLNGLTEEDELLNKIGEYLKDTGSIYYTCHCTGLKAYETLKSIIGDKMRYLSAGSVVEI